jgi:hypothetical protein
MAFIQRYTGYKFDLIDATVDDIKIADIAHSLACSNRFYGHTFAPYSIAQHSIICADIAKQRGVDQMSLLLHDATEAYVGDVAKHIKEFLGDRYANLENRIARIIADKYSTCWQLTPSMKQIDYDVLETEFRDLMRRGKFPDRPVYGKAIKDLHIQVWPWHYAEDQFLNRFHTLGGVD